MNARIHVLLCSERKEHEGCHASVEAEIISETKEFHNALFQQVLIRSILKAKHTCLVSIVQGEHAVNRLVAVVTEHTSCPSTSIK